jgi:flagellar FliL protein
MATSPQVAIPAPAAAPRSSKLLIGLLIAVGVLAAGAVGYILLAPKLAGGTSEAAKPAALEKPIFVTLEPLTVNLQAEGKGRFLHIGISLKVKDEQAKGQITEFMPELRSRVLMLLSNRAPESLVSPEDKTKLADEIQKALNAPLSPQLPSQGITGVSFNTFVVQ